MRVLRLDHLVLTVADVARSTDFYVRVLGMQHVTFENGREALTFGEQKINLHRRGQEVVPHAGRPEPGSADLCFVVEAGTAQVLRRLAECGVDVELGPVRRSGATGPIESVYVRDPDGILVEIAHAAEEHAA